MEQAVHTDIEQAIWLDPGWLSPTTLTGFEYENPMAFWLLLAMPVLLFFRWLIVRFYRQRLGVVTFHGKLKWNSAALLRLIPYGILVLFWAALVVALARPQRSDEKVEHWTEGIDIVLVMDVSGSMKLQDFEPNRLEAAKEVAANFIAGRKQDRIGVVVFASDAFSMAPMTSDYALLNSVIKENVRLGMMQSESTAIGNALVVGVNHMKDSEAKTKVMILISDGENTGGNVDPVTAAELAYGYGIKIYSIGIGKDGKVPVGRNFLGMTNYVISNLDETNLKEIAAIGKGEYFRATDVQALERIFNRINTYEKTEYKENRYKNTEDFYQIYLYWGLSFFLFWLFLKSTFISNALED